MGNNIIYRYLIIILILLICKPGFSQSKIHPDLANKLSLTTAEQTVSGIIMMSDQVDVASLVSTCSQNKYSRQEQHRIVVQALKDKAAQSEAGILQQLQTLSNIKSIKSLWIVNAIIIEGTSDAFNTIAQRLDVAMIYLNYPLENVIPVSESSAIQASNGAEDGLKLINAHLLWKKGITGEGRIASHIDTGVDGAHPALTSKWRGATSGVTPQEAWFDPITNTTYPFDSGTHGTHTMGTIVGQVSGDTIGVAFGAKWISAGVIDRGGIQATIQNALLALQWVADPDGNPNTITDVPDVCSNSWGIPQGYLPQCDNTFWNAIDNVEAATVAVVFAAGNEGSGSQTLRTPADRITTLTNCFSVGALDTDGTTIANYSSRGPSGCSGTDAQRIKPEIVARGSNVRSSIPGGGYGLKSGTSMATPHVAGAICLLRQVAPDATVEEIKNALLNSTIDLGTTGEDNTYGHGRIDVYAAAQLLSSCKKDLNITDNITGGTLTFLASSSITASNSISGSASVHYGANSSVKLTTGFTVSSGNTFLADLNGCNATSALLKSTLAENNKTASKEQANLVAKEIDKPLDNSNVVLHPNPTTGKLFVKGLTDFEATVYDLSGSVLLTITKGNGSIDISGLSTGVYMVQLKCAGKVYKYKIAKQ
jgi:subtilisin family serine protease